MRLYTKIPSIKKFPINNYNYHQNLNINLSLYSDSINKGKQNNDYRDSSANYKPNLYSNEDYRTTDYNYSSRNKHHQSPNQLNDNKLSDRIFKYTKLTPNNYDIFDKNIENKNFKKRNHFPKYPTKIKLENKYIMQKDRNNYKTVNKKELNNKNKYDILENKILPIYSKFYEEKSQNKKHLRTKSNITDGNREYYKIDSPKEKIYDENNKSSATLKSKKEDELNISFPDENDNFIKSKFITKNINILCPSKEIEFTILKNALDINKIIDDEKHETSFGSIKDGQAKKDNSSSLNSICLNFPCNEQSFEILSKTDNKWIIQKLNEKKSVKIEIDNSNIDDINKKLEDSDFKIEGKKVRFILMEELEKMDEIKINSDNLYNENNLLRKKIKEIYDYYQQIYQQNLLLHEENLKIKHEFNQLNDKTG